MSEGRTPRGGAERLQTGKLNGGVPKDRPSIADRLYRNQLGILLAVALTVAAVAVVLLHLEG